MGEFRVLNEFPGYEISRAGEVRRIGGGLLGVRVRSSGMRWVQLSNSGKTTSRNISVLLVDAYGSGAASAAGLKEPDMVRVRRARGRQGRARSGRVCHDCGRPTANYRCESCWRGVRGYGASAASDFASPFDI